MDAGLIALNRFGLGKRARETLPDHPKSWLLSQFDRFRPGLAGIESLASKSAIVRRTSEYRTEIRKREMGGEPGGAMADASDDKSLSDEFRQFIRSQYAAQIGVRARGAVMSETPFVDRLVHFWSNHFAVSADKTFTVALAGLFEFEAIRPHVLGRFEDMLLAVEQHPAMLFYLDQMQSIGPNSFVGSRAKRKGRKVGLNENLGREILELHTLGVRTGYDQQDVIELARALTGWTVSGVGRSRLMRRMTGGVRAGEFYFAAPLHEPGARMILGRSYAQEGVAQARAVLSDLARHPSTARHVATKLARHFVADDPPASLVARLEQAYLENDGYLPALYRALTDAPEAWHPEPAKFRMPWDWLIATFRGLSGTGRESTLRLPDERLAGILVELGQPVWKPGSPAGYDDRASNWAAPDALYRRVELVGRIAERVSPNVDPHILADALFAGGLTMATRETVTRADSASQALALLLVAPEMLRC